MAKEEKLVDRAREHLEPGEEVLAAVLGTCEVKIMGSDSTRTGVLIATDRRVVFYAKKMTGFDLESYPYSTISSIDQGKNLMGHNVTFYASGNKIAMKWIKDTAKLASFMNTAKAHIHARTTIPHESSSQEPSPGELTPPPESPPESAVVAQLKSLGELRDAGVLTEEEFASKKAELLKRL